MEKAYNRINWQNQPSTATALGATNLNRIDAGLNDVDNRVIGLNTTKLDVSDALTMVANWDMNLTTGVITVTLKNGTVQTYDTALEKVPISGVINTETNKLVFTNSDGTTTEVDIAKLITQYEFIDTDTIGFTIASDGKVSCFVKDGSIAGEKLETNYLANCQLASVTATTQAALSKRYAVGGVETGDATDNAQYYCQQAQLARDQAQSIVGVGIADNNNPGLVKAGNNVTVAVDGEMDVGPDILKKDNIANNLIVTAEGYALDARQGKILNDNINLSKGVWTPTLKAGGEELTITDNSSSYYIVGDLCFLSLCIWGSIINPNDDILCIYLPVNATSARNYGIVGYNWINNVSNPNCIAIGDHMSFICHDLEADGHSRGAKGTDFANFIIQASITYAIR